MSETIAAPARVHAKPLMDFITRAFVKVGVPAADADMLAQLMVEADLRGGDTHGVIRLPLYVRRIRAGGVNPKPDIRVVNERPSAALIDGGNGMGHLVMRRAAQIAIEKAKATGVGWVGARMSNHAGPAGLYAMMPLAHDMIGLYFAMGSNNHLPPWGGAESLLGTSPMAIAVPAQDEPPVVLDMAPTVAAFGKVRLKAQMNEPMPVGWMIDKEGKPLTDAKKADEGHLLPIGDYKGSGLESDHRAARRRAQSRGDRARGDRFRQGYRQGDQHRPRHLRAGDRHVRAGRRFQARGRRHHPRHPQFAAAARRRAYLASRRAESRQVAGASRQRHSHSEAAARQPRRRRARPRHRAARMSCAITT